MNLGVAKNAGALLRRLYNTVVYKKNIVPQQ